MRTRSVFAGMRQDASAASLEDVRCFLVEIPVAEPALVELERATGTLRAAQARLPGRGALPNAEIVEVVLDNGRLVCLIQAPSLLDVRRLVALALLPGGRIREVPSVDSARLRSSWSAPRLDPGGDLRPGAESELVEDVVDVSFDGPLGDE